MVSTTGQSGTYRDEKLSRGAPPGAARPLLEPESETPPDLDQGAFNQAV